MLLLMIVFLDALLGLIGLAGILCVLFACAYGALTILDLVTGY